MGKAPKQTADLTIYLLRIAFNRQDETPQKRIFAGTNKDVLEALEDFMLSLNNAGIFLKPKLCKKLMEDLGCMKFSVPKDEKDISPPEIKSGDNTNILAPDEALARFIARLKELDIALDKKIIKKIRNDINTQSQSNAAPSSDGDTFDNP